MYYLFIYQRIVITFTQLLPWNHVSYNIYFKIYTFHYSIFDNYLSFDLHINISFEYYLWILTSKDWNTPSGLLFMTSRELCMKLPLHYPNTFQLELMLNFSKMNTYKNCRLFGKLWLAYIQICSIITFAFPEYSFAVRIIIKSLFAWI